MTAKEYLSQARELDAQINTYLFEIERLETLAEKTTGTLKNDKVQVSVDKQKMENAVIKLTTYKSKVADAITECIRVKETIGQQIKGIDDKVYRNILWERYVSGETFEHIAVNRHYSYRHTTRLHGAALIAFGEKYKDVLECPIQ